MPQPLCPSADSLRDFALGRFEGREFESVAEHVELCLTCQSRLEGLDQSPDPLVDQLQNLSTTAVAEINEEEQFWTSAVLSGKARSGLIRIAADAGIGLARRLLEGPVYLDRFELRSELGVGSFGYVFQAWDPRLERVVALKVQRAGNFASAEDVERFLREARSAAQLKHPSIVSLYETGQTEEGVWYLVCELIDGHTLEKRLQDHSEGLAPFEAATIASELAAAIHYAHEHGVIHRDIYSLGVVLYEMITGERPFRGDRRELLMQVMEDDPRPPRRIRPEIPRDPEIICLQAMSKSPSRRYQSGLEMEADLRRFLEGRQTLARPIGSVERTLRWCRRYPLAVSVFFAVVVGSIAGLWYLSSLSEYFVRQTALESARLENKMLDEVWRFYSERIEEINFKTSGVAVTQNYLDIHPSLPLPATFSIDLGERISRRNPGMEVRVYGRHPWPGREKGGPQDEMERAALNWLETNARPTDEPQQEYTRFVEADGRRELHYYAARHMEKSCLGCHNDLSRFRKDRPGDTFRGWLRVIARSKVMDYFNSRNREPAGAGGTEASVRLQEILDPCAIVGMDAEKSAIDEELVFNEVLLRALESIRGEFHERTWQAFWKVVVEGRDTSDVAAELSMKPGTVRVSKSRVLHRLRHELGDLGQ